MPSTEYMKSRTALAESFVGSIASLMHYATLEGGSTSSMSPVPSNDNPGTIRCRGSARAINGATLLVWYAPKIPDPFTPWSFRVWRAVRRSVMCFFSLVRTPHFHDSRAS